MDSLAKLFDEWAASYARGEHPDPLAFLQRAGGQADELARLMDAFLRHAPRNEPTEETLSLARAWVDGESPLAVLRANRGIPRETVVDAVMTVFELPSKRRAKVKGYYHDLELGRLDPAGLDTRLADLLARTLGATRDVILSWRPRPLEPQAAFFRSSAPVDLQSPDPQSSEEPRDEVDALFLSDR